MPGITDSALDDSVRTTLSEVGHLEVENNEDDQSLNFDLQDDLVTLGSLEQSDPKTGLLSNMYKILLKRLDCSGILLDQLITYSLITDLDRKAIERCCRLHPLDFYSSNAKLLHILARRYPTNCAEKDTVTRALEGSNQKHLKCLINRQTGYNGNENPAMLEYLTESEMKSIETHDNRLCELMKCSQSFIDALKRRRCISNRHQARLQNLLAEMDQCQFILDVVKRGSRDNFDQFLEALEEDGQPEVVEYIQGKMEIKHLAVLHVAISFGRNDIYKSLHSRKSTVVSYLTLDDNSPCRQIDLPPGFIGAEGPMTCECNNVLYLIAGKSLWKFDPWENNWSACADLPTEKHYASIEATGDSLYVLGGRAQRRSKTLLQQYSGLSDCVLKYNIETNEWQRLEGTNYNKEKAASVLYKNCIYLFDGFDNEELKPKFVEIFNIVTGEIKTQKVQWLPDQGQIKAVAYKHLAILVGMEYVMIYDLHNEILVTKIKCSSDRRNFGLTICEDFIYLIGGSKVGLESKQCSKEVKRLSISSLLNKQEQSRLAWEHFADLNEFSEFQFCSRTTFRIAMSQQLDSIGQKHKGPFQS